MNKTTASIIFLISCSKEKLSQRTSAQHLYISKRFKLSRSLANDYADKWFIVSAKHHLLSPETNIDPYEKLLSEMEQNDRKKWANKICNQLSKHITKDSQVVCLGDPNYFEELSHWLIKNKIRIFIPFLHLAKEKRLDWLTQAQRSSSRSQHIDTLYSLLNDPTLQSFHLRAFHECSGSIDWPNRGLYIFYHPDEKRMLAPTTLRIVRIGTHAVSAGSKSTLWQRLKTHKGDMKGGGNHRGSVFRLHVGSAIIARDGLYCTSWGIGQSAKKSIRNKEIHVEQKVSDYINNLHVLYLNIEDSPSKTSDRAYLEQNIIALLSGQVGPIEFADETWLGYYSTNATIRRSSLWNVDYTDREYDPNFLEVLSAYVDVSTGRRSHPSQSLAPLSWLSNATLGYQQQTLDFS